MSIFGVSVVLHFIKILSGFGNLCHVSSLKLAFSSTFANFHICYFSEMPTTLPKKPTTGSTKITAFPTKTSNTIPVQQTELPTTSSVPVNQTKGEKSRPETDERQHLKKEAATAVIILSVLVFILLVLAVVLFVVNRNRQKSAGNEGEVGRSDVGRRLAQQQCEVPREGHLHHRPPIQATSTSRIRIDG